MLDTMVDLKSSKGDSNENMSKLEDGKTKDGPTRRFSVTDFWKRLPVDQDEADSIGSRKHVVKDAKLVLQLNIFQFPPNLRTISNQCIDCHLHFSLRGANNL